MPNKHIVFLVHGMGKHAGGWSNEAQSLLRDNFSRYDAVNWKPFNERFEFCEVSYDDEFEALRDLWKSQQQGLGTVLQAQGITGTLVNQLNELAGVTEKDSFINTHVLDVLLYRYARQTAGAVRDSVRKQMLDKLSTLDANEPIRWSVVAHSLGTGVIHDTLHGLYTDQLPGGQQLAQLTRPQLLAMVANVSRVVESDVDVYKSVVTPGAPDGNCAVRSYLNIHHDWDPFTLPRAFRPKPDWPTLEVRAQDLYRDITINTIEELNVHGLEHYLRNPKVHTAIFNAMLGVDAIDTAAIRAAHLKYVSTIQQGRFEILVETLKDYTISEREELDRIIKKWLAFQELVENAG